MGQQAVHSLALGSIYALLAVGFTFMYGAHRSLYLAYGGLYALGGYVAWWIMRAHGGVWLALGVAVVLCALAGCLIYWMLQARLHDASELSYLFTGLGLLVCLEEVYRLAIGPYRLKVVALDSHQVHSLGPLMVTDAHWLVFAGAFALFTIIQGWLSTSRTGRSLHALLRHPDGELLAPDQHWVRGLASGLGAALAGISGVLAGFYLNDVHPAMGTAMTPKLLALVLIGTLGSLRGAIGVAFALALAEGVLLPTTHMPVPSEALLLATLALVGLGRRREHGRRWSREG